MAARLWHTCHHHSGNHRDLWHAGGTVLSVTALRRYHGLSDNSLLALPYIIYGMFVAHLRGDMSRGVSIADFGKQLADSTDTRNQEVSLINFFYAHFLGAWRMPRSELPQLNQVDKYATEVSAAPSVIGRHLCFFVDGRELGEVEHMVTASDGRLRDERLQRFRTIHRTICQSITYLADGAGGDGADESVGQRLPMPHELDKTGHDFTDILQAIAVLHAAIMSRDWHVATAWVGSLTSNDPRLGMYLADVMVWQSVLALERAREAESVGFVGSVGVADGVGGQDDGKRVRQRHLHWPLRHRPWHLRGALRQAKRNQARLEQWSEMVPQNFAHLSHLLKAEIARARGHHIEAQGAYRRAIDSCSGGNRYNYCAFAAAQASQYYRDIGLMDLSETYAEEAHSAYTAWGAHAVARQWTSADWRIAEGTGVGDRFSTQPRAYGSATSDTDLAANARFDIDTLMQVCELLTREIVLDRLIERFLAYLMKHAGADRAALVLAMGGSPEVVAAADDTGVELIADEPLDHSDRLPRSIARHCLQHGEPIIVDDAQTDTVFAGEPYIAAHRPKAMMCLRLDNRNTAVGVIYLGNSMTKAAFGAERVALVRTLSTQAAITLQNAYLYGQLTAANANLEAEVERRTRELHATQRELIERSRHAGRADIAARVLHELGNAMNSATTSVSLLQNNLDEIDGRRRLERLSKLLHQGGERLDRLIHGNGGGSVLARYIDKIVAIGTQQRQTLSDELNHLDALMDHMRVLLAAQEEYARRDTFAESLHIQPLIGECLQRIITAEHEIEVQTHFAPLGVVMLDRIKMAEILQSLLRYLCERLRGVDDAHLLIRLTRDDAGQIVIAMRDNGPALDDEECQQLFRARGIHGAASAAGVLHHCATEVMSMHGTVTASNTDDGFCFTVILPYQEEKSASNRG